MGTFSMKLSQLSKHLSNLENHVKTLEINKQSYISPTVNTEYQDSTSLQEPSPLESKNWESRIFNLETNWAQFLQINDKTNQEMENLLNTAGFIKSEGSGLTDETDELTNLPPSLEAFASLCDIITKSLNITLKPRQKRSQTASINVSKAPDNEEPPDTEKPSSILDLLPPPITQVFDKASDTYYVPMGKCVTCSVIVTSISITIVITFTNSIALCILGRTLYKTKKQLKRIIEKKSPKREAPEKGLITAALRPHKRETSRPRARNREQTYKIYPAKGINQDSPHLPHNFIPIIAGL